MLATQSICLVASAMHVDQVGHNLASSCFKLYGLDASLRAVGLNSRMATMYIFHDVLHAVSYEQVVAVGMSPSAGLAAKIATPIAKRLPVFPGGVAFIRSPVALAAFALYDAWKAVARYRPAQGDGPTEGAGMAPFMAEDPAGYRDMVNFRTAMHALDPRVTGNG